jgi:hypothetical protein
MNYNRNDCPEWGSLPAEVQAEVGRLESAMEIIDAAASKLDKCKEIARNAGGMRGWSSSRLRSKYYDWLNNGRTWTSLVNWAKVGNSRQTPRSMCDTLFKHYCGQHQRSSKKAHEHMLHDIWSGKRLSGIGPGGRDGDWTDIFHACYPNLTTPSRCPFGWIPKGMSYRNMQHYAKLSKREAAIMRIGVKAAHKYVPAVYSTRVGLQPGMIYQFDDVWHDVSVILPGINKGLARPLEFCAIDYASTYKAAYGLSCQMEREDGSRTGLKEREMLWLVCHILTNVGYHCDGCVFVLEHGTAAVRPHVREIIERLTDGKVTFRTSEIIGASLVRGMFDGSGKGNFKAKALVEQSHRLLHHQADYLPAQTGGNSRSNRPEQLDGITSYAREIVKAWEQMSPDQQRLLWMPALTFWAYRPVVADIYRAIYNRTDHQCEGFESNNWMVAEYSIDGIGNWQPVDNIQYLPQSMQALAHAACREPGHIRARRMSPREVWQSGQDNLIRLPPWAVASILGDSYRHKATVKDNGLLEFQDATIEPGRRFRFQSRVLTPGGDAYLLSPGAEVYVYAMPYDDSKAVLADADTGDILGVVPAWNAVSPINATQVETAIEAQKRIIAAVDAPLRERHAQDGLMLESLKISNAHLIEDARMVTDRPAARQQLPPTEDIDLTNFFSPDFNKQHKEGDPNEY